MTNSEKQQSFEQAHLLTRTDKRQSSEDCRLLQMSKKLQGKGIWGSQPNDATRT